MPPSDDMKKVKAAMVKKYGAQKGEQMFQAWLNKHKLDETKPIPKEKKKMKESASYEFFGLVPAEIKESGIEEGTGRKWCVIGGTALTTTTSRNGIKYTQQNITENNGKRGKFFVEHDLTVPNLVGDVKFIEENGDLRYQARIKNTAKHPDIVEQAMDGLLDVSIDARYKDLVPQEEGDYAVEGLDIRALVATGIGGVKENTVEYAIMESYNGVSTSDIHTIIDEVNAMSEEISKPQVDETILKEHEETKKRLAEAEQKLASIKEAEKKAVVTSIVSSNKQRGGSLTEEKLLAMSDDALAVVKSFEEEESARYKKAQEEQKKEESKFGSGFVEIQREAPQTVAVQESDFSKYVIESSDESGHYVSLHPKAWGEFNRQLRGETKDLFSSIPDNPNRKKYGR